MQTLLQYPDDVQVYFEGTFVNARNGAMLEFMGSEATLYLDRGRYEIHPERNKKIAASELMLGSGPRGADFYDKPDGEVLHLANWIECVRSRKKPNCPAEAGVGAASAAHLGNIALRSGQVANWKSLTRAACACQQTDLGFENQQQLGACVIRLSMDHLHGLGQRHACGSGFVRCLRATWGRKLSERARNNRVGETTTEVNGSHTPRSIHSLGRDTQLFLQFAPGG